MINDSSWRSLIKIPHEQKSPLTDIGNGDLKYIQYAGEILI